MLYSALYPVPMCFDLPTMQAVFPNVSTLHLFNISRTPRGVAGIKAGLPVTYLPIKYGLSVYSKCSLHLTNIQQVEPINVLKWTYRLTD